MDGNATTSGLAPDVGGLLSSAADGDEDAFAQLLDTCAGQLRRLAIALLGRPRGDEIMGDVWRTALANWPSTTPAAADTARSWLCQVVVEQAQEHGAIVDVHVDGPMSVDPDRFLPAGHRWAGHWASPPAPWNTALDRDRIGDVVWRALGSLSSAARAVTILRDVDGFPDTLVSHVLGLDAATQRKLLHVGRTAVRRSLEDVLVPLH